MKRDLHVRIGSNTKTIKIVDEFEGLDGGKPYERIIIDNAMIKRKDNNEYMWIHLIVQRFTFAEHAGKITFTEFKKENKPEFRKYIMDQIEKSNVYDIGEILFDKPYLLRAQNSNNRTGYGWEWDWSNHYIPSITEGTFYGETTNYSITGCFLGEYR